MFAIASAILATAIPHNQPRPHLRFDLFSYYSIKIWNSFVELQLEILSILGRCCLRDKFCCTISHFSKVFDHKLKYKIIIKNNHSKG